MHAKFQATWFNNNKKKYKELSGPLKPIKTNKCIFHPYDQRKNKLPKINNMSNSHCILKVNKHNIWFF